MLIKSTFSNNLQVWKHKFLLSKTQSVTCVSKSEQVSFEVKNEAKLKVRRGEFDT